MFVRRTVPASVQPVSLDLVETHLKISAASEAKLLDGILLAACQQVAEMTGRVLSPETWTIADRSFSGDVLLPKSPVTSLVSVKWYDGSDVLQTSSVGDFYLIADEDRAIVKPKPGKAWPVSNGRDDGVQIEVVAGYAVGAVPQPLAAAILMLTGHLYSNREAVVTGTSATELPLGVADICNLFRQGWVKP